MCMSCLIVACALLWMQVTLIERQEGFMYHTIAALRAVVDDETARRVLVPLDNLLQRGKLVIGSVVDIRANEVLLDNGDAIPFDTLVIATGAASRFPVRAFCEPTDG